MEQKIEERRVPPYLTVVSHEPDGPDLAPPSLEPDLTNVDRPPPWEMPERSAGEKRAKPNNKSVAGINILAALNTQCRFIID